MNGSGTSLSRSGFTLPELLISLLLVAVVALLGISASSGMTAYTKKIRCATHLRNLHVVFNDYAADHRECYPIGFISSASNNGNGQKVWTGILRAYRPEIYSNYSAREGIVYCPATRVGGTVPFRRDNMTWRTDYNINSAVATRVEADNRRSLIRGNAIFLFDGGGRADYSTGTAIPHLRHFDGFNILFVDGHVESTSSFTGYESRWSRQ